MPPLPEEPVAETAAVADPMVALGTGPLPPFWAVALLDSVANPMEAGLYRKTE